MFAMVLMIQYINETQKRQILIFNSRKIASITTGNNGVLSRVNPVYRAPTEQLKVKVVTSSFVSKITPKPNLKRLINATKTKYPLTVNAPYIMENPELCTSVRNLSVLVIVHTAPDHFERRQAMRDTWLNNTYYSHLGSARVLFLLGRVKNKELQMKLEMEYKAHRDLLQGDFIDAYRNLTHKGVMGFKWISEKCRNAKYILKVDDDVIVNMFKFFIEYLPKYKGKTKQILCNHIYPGTMLIIRERKSKWYVDESHFKGQKFYPRYCSGFMVMFTNDVIPAIYRSASLTPFFWVDDVYLYGLAPGNVPGIHYNGLKKGSHQLNGQSAIKCYRNASRACDFLVAGAGKREVMVEIWSNMVNLHQKYLKEQRLLTTEQTTLQYDTSTDSSSFENTKSVKQISDEKAKLDLIMKGKQLIVGKLVNKLETGNGNI
jgi:beta-1,3-galactosyltransferase 1